jgi:hypothetical protein
MSEAAARDIVIKAYCRASHAALQPFSALLFTAAPYRVSSCASGSGPTQSASINASVPSSSTFSLVRPDAARRPQAQICTAVDKSPADTRSAAASGVHERRAPIACPQINVRADLPEHKSNVSASPVPGCTVQCGSAVAASNVLVTAACNGARTGATPCCGGAECSAPRHRPQEGA